MAAAGSLRISQRLAVMRRVQFAAFELFSRDGFASVSIERIAEKAETSPATVYRHFGTKDRIVIWDEADENLAATLWIVFADSDFSTALLRFASILDSADGPARSTTLRRLKLIAREPSIKAQAIVNATEFAEQIGAALAARDGRGTPRFDDIVAGQTAAGILTASILEWARRGGRKPLTDIVKLGLESVRSIVDDSKT